MPSWAISLVAVGGVASAEISPTTSALASSSPASWSRHAGVDCSSTDLDVEKQSTFVVSGSNVGNMSLHECQQRCLDTPDCNAVTVDVEIAEWTVHQGANCYSGHGARDLVDGDGTIDSCFAMALEQCRSQCLLTPKCTGWQVVFVYVCLDV